MPPAHDFLRGWSPIGDDDDEVNISPPPAPPTMSSHSMAPSSDRRAQRNRSRDPSWIPRPRNAFIIFRCEYSRDHSRGAQEPQSDDDSTSHTAKTLSKRASEAWKQLPAAERERYKVLANKEREEHARLYPHYRFRPVKRQALGQAGPSHESSQGPSMSSAEHPPAPSVCTPSVLAQAAAKPQLSPPIEHAGTSATGSQTGRLSLPESRFPIDSQAGPSRVSAPLFPDYSGPLLPFSFPETALPSDLAQLSAPAESYAPLRRSAANPPPGAPGGGNTRSSQDDIERAQALEAYAIGLYNHDLIPLFPFPDYTSGGSSDS